MSVVGTTASHYGKPKRTFFPFTVKVCLWKNSITFIRIQFGPHWPKGHWSIVGPVLGFGAGVHLKMSRYLLIRMLFIGDSLVDAGRAEPVPGAQPLAFW